MGIRNSYRSQVACPLPLQRPQLSSVPEVSRDLCNGLLCLLHLLQPLQSGSCVLAGGEPPAARAEDDRQDQKAWFGSPAAALFQNQRSHFWIWATAGTSAMAHGLRTSVQGPPGCSIPPLCQKGQGSQGEDKRMYSVESACLGSNHHSTHREKALRPWTSAYAGIA